MGLEDQKQGGTAGAFLLWGLGASCTIEDLGWGANETDGRPGDKSSLRDGGFRKSDHSSSEDGIA